jgi:hypothetical protein
MAIIVIVIERKSEPTKIAGYKSKLKSVFSEETETFWYEKEGGK